jgi:hypothetical protein
VIEKLISGGISMAPVLAGTGVVPVVASHGVAPVVLDPVVDGEVAGPVAAAGAVRAMRWTNNTSGFVLRRMATMVSDHSRSDKVFRQGCRPSGQSP